MESDHFDIIIIGGGIAGHACAAAILNHIPHLKVKLFEKAKAMFPAGAALGLFSNGLSSLKVISVDAWERVVSSSIKCERMVTYNLNGEKIRDTEASSETPSYLVWYLLQKYLYEGCPEDVLELGKQFVGYQIDKMTNFVNVTVEDRLGHVAQRTTYSCKILIGADGINSAVRNHMLSEDVPKNYHGKMMFRATYHNEDIPDSSVLPPPGVMVSYQGHEPGKLFAYRETAEGIGTYTAMAKMINPILIKDSKDKLLRIHEIFKDFPSEVHYIIDHCLPNSLYESILQDIDIVPVWSDGPVCLLGDAAHAMTSGLGQGANQALEDAAELVYYLIPIFSKQPSKCYSDCKDYEEKDESKSESKCSDCKHHKQATELTEKQLNRIPLALERFYEARMIRVREVHEFSAAMTKVINQSNAQNLAYNRKESDEKKAEFMTRLYAWEPLLLNDSIRSRASEASLDSDSKKESSKSILDTLRSRNSDIDVEK